MEEVSTTQMYLKTNWSLDEKNPSVKTQLALYDYLIPSIGALIILLNLAVVISSGLIMKKGQQPRSTYLFLGNVAMTDLITGVAVVSGQLFPKENRNHNVCAIHLGMIVSSTLASVYSVGLIAIDRFLYIIHGIQYQQWVYPNRARLLILGTWIIGCIIGFLPLFGWSGDTKNGKICWFIFLAPKELIILTVLVGIIPLIVVVILYSIILYHAIKNVIRLKNASNNSTVNNNNQLGNGLRIFRGNSSSIQPEINTTTTTNRSTLLSKIFKRQPLSSSSSTRVRQPTKWKAIKVVLFTTSSFLITWCPYFITSLIYVYQCDNLDTKRCKNFRIVIASPLAILGFTNSLINPIIYAWWHKGFRTFVKKRVSVVIMKSRFRNSISYIINNSTNNHRRNSSCTNDNNKNSSSLSNIENVSTDPTT